MSRVEKFGKKRRKRKWFLAVVLMITAAYLGGMSFFYYHFFPNTKVGNIEIGWKTEEQAREHVKNELEKYTLTVLEKEGEEKISATDAGLSFYDIDKIARILDDQPFALWPIKVAEEYSFNELNIQVDADILNSYVDTLRCMNPEVPEGPTDASITYNKKKKKYQIVPASIGNIVDKPHFIAGLTDALTHHVRDISLVEDTYYVQPKYKADSPEVKNAYKIMNKYLDGVVTYKDGPEKMKAYKKDIAGMVVCSKDFKVKIKEKKVKAFVKNKVAKKFNSLEGPIPEGITAWEVNVDEETKKLTKNIVSGKRETRKPVYAQEGFDRDEYGVGNTYIDVSISDQRMWYVEGGKIRLSSDVVTGNESTGHGTTPGFYRIAFKQRDHLMVKYNSFVHYWMPYNTTVGVGFHDASWRGAFGGQIYRTNGSHGCINMPPPKAAELYGMISAGTAVYVHW